MQIQNDRRLIRGDQGLGGEGAGELLIHGYRVCLGKTKKGLQVDNGDSGTILCM